MDNKLYDLLADKVASVKISSYCGEGKDKKQTIKALKMDSIKDGEETSGDICIEILNKQKKGICDYLRMNGWPSCDYLYICKTVDNSKVIFYLIEQTDLKETFFNKMLYEKVDGLPKGPSLKNKSQIIIYSLIEENRRKFFSSAFIVAMLQMQPLLKNMLPQNQIYHFTLLDIPISKKIKLGDASTRRIIKKQIKIDFEIKLAEIKKYLRDNLDDYKNNIYKQLDDAIKTLKKKQGYGPAISTGETIYSFSNLINSIESYRKH